MSPGIKILQQCENALREQLSVSAESGDYESVLRLTNWARQINRMMNDEGAVHAPALSGKIIADPVNKSAPHQAKSKAATARKSIKRKTQTGYPQFMRQKDELIKIGWSRRDKKEYQHRAPRQVVELLINRLVALGGSQLFTTDELFPLIDQTEGSEVPIYQSYICLAWLRHENLVIAEGRQGYRISDPGHLREAWGEAWHRLPDYRA